MAEVQLFIRLRYPNDDISEEIIENIIYDKNSIKLCDKLIELENKVLSEKCNKYCTICCKGYRFID